MSDQTVVSPVLSEETWNAWLEKGKREEVARVRSVRILAGFGVALASAVIWALRVY